MRHSNPYKFQAARRRKDNLYKSKQSSTGTRNDLNKCDVEELIPEGSQAQYVFCMHGDVTELFLAETNSMMPGEACNYLQVNDMDSSRESPLEDDNNLRIILDELELLDFADFEQFVKDVDACLDLFSEN